MSVNLMSLVVRTTRAWSLAIQIELDVEVRRHFRRVVCHKWQLDPAQTNLPEATRSMPQEPIRTVFGRSIARGSRPMSISRLFQH